MLWNDISVSFFSLGYIVGLSIDTSALRSLICGLKNHT